MPHIVIEYSNNVKSDIQQSGIAQTAHNLTVDSGLFSPEAVKSRSIGYDDYTLPESAKSFVHITISILNGRDIEVRKSLSDTVFEKAKELLPTVDKISVNIHEMEKETYNK